MVTHTGIKAYLCPECGNSFGSASTLIDHRKRKHLEMRDHKCEECSKGFFTRQELEAHERTHTGLKPYACEVSINENMNECSPMLLDSPVNFVSFPQIQVSLWRHNKPG